MWLADHQLSSYPLPEVAIDYAVERGPVAALIPKRALGVPPTLKPRDVSGWGVVRVSVVGPFLTLTDFDGASWFGTPDGKACGNDISGRSLDFGIFGWAVHLGEWITGIHWSRPSRSGSAPPN